MGSNYKAVNKTLDDLYRYYQKMLVQIVTTDSKLLETHTKQTYLQGGTTATRLRKRTVRLQASTKAVPTTVIDNTVRGGIQFGTAYAGIHISRPGRFGDYTTIRPVNKKFLTIPLPAAQTRAGVLRGGATSGLWQNTFIKRNNNGNLIIYGVSKVKIAGKVGKIIPLFLLVKQVRVPFRIDSLWLMKWARKKLEDDIEKMTTGGNLPI